VAGTQWILGVQPTFAGLRITPVIPESWKGFSIQRTFRGSIYNITAVRVGKGNRVALEVNGNPLEGNVIPLPDAPDPAIEVRVMIGSERWRNTDFTGI